MEKRQAVQVGTVQETLLIPLYCRAAESRRKRPILEDPKAVEMVDSIDWEFQRFAQRQRVVACVLRTAIFDWWIRQFLSRYPDGTVIEIGTGLNTRFERLDNGRVHWFDLDLPDTIALRRRFFADSDRRAMVAASVLDMDWMATVERSPGPYIFAAEAVFLYLEEPKVRVALAEITRRFPGCTMVIDTANRKAVEGGNRDFAKKGMAARFQWSCEDPREVDRWNIGLRLLETRTLLEVPDPVRRRLSLPLRVTCSTFQKLFPKQMGAYRLNLFDARQ